MNDDNGMYVFRLVRAIGVGFCVSLLSTIYYLCLLTCCVKREAIL